MLFRIGVRFHLRFCLLSSSILNTCVMFTIPRGYTIATSNHVYELGRYLNCQLWKGTEGVGHATTGWIPASDGLPFYFFCLRQYPFPAISLLFFFFPSFCDLFPCSFSAYAFFSRYCHHVGFPYVPHLVYFRMGVVYGRGVGEEGGGEVCSVYYYFRGYLPGAFFSSH